jgi:hypothetical protein
VQLESDAQNFINVLQGNQFDLAPEGIMHRDTRIFSRLNFLSVEFLFCPRGCNKLAHELATHGAHRQELRSLWLESFFLLESLPDYVSVPVAS